MAETVFSDLPPSKPKYNEIQSLESSLYATLSSSLATIIKQRLDIGDYHYGDKLQVWPQKLRNYTSFSVSECVFIELNGSAASLPWAFSSTTGMCTIQKSTVWRGNDLTDVSCQLKRMRYFSLFL